jgi:hypothetical protein
MLGYRTRETSTTTGTGTLDLDGAVGTGFRAFADDIATGRKVLYNIISVDANGDGDYEEGIGTLTHGTPDTLTRDTVIRSSNGGNKVSWGAGTKYVFCDIVPDYTPVERTAESIASATTTSIGNAAGNFVHITGTTAITSFGTAPVAGKRITVTFDGSLTLTHGSNLVLPGLQSITTQAGDVATFRADTTTKWVCESYTRMFCAPVGGEILRGHLWGLTLSNNSGDPTNDIDIAAGVAVSDDGTYVMRLTSGLIKRLDAAWAAGTNQGMLDTGSIANDVYHVFLIGNPTTGAVDVVCSASASLTAAPSGYTKKRHIGTIERASNALRTFLQDGDTFWLKDPVMPIDATNPGTSAVTRTLTGIPDGIAVEAILNVVVTDNAQSGGCYLSSLDVDDEAASSTAAPLAQVSWANTGGATLASGQVRARTNTSAQIRSRLNASGASTVLRIVVLGWVYKRGRDS